VATSFQQKQTNVYEAVWAPDAVRKIRKKKKEKMLPQSYRPQLPAIPTELSAK
jgi:hypothetical protein